MANCVLMFFPSEELRRKVVIGKSNSWAIYLSNLQNICIKSQMNLKEIIGKAWIHPFQDMQSNQHSTKGEEEWVRNSRLCLFLSGNYGMCIYGFVGEVRIYKYSP